MSWWDASGLGSFASQALKQAQKKIDKVLDISGEEGTTGTAGKTASDAKQDDAAAQLSPTASLSTDKSDKKNDNTESAGEGRSSWAMPWSMDSSMFDDVMSKGSVIKDNLSKTSPFSKAKEVKTSTRSSLTGKSGEVKSIQQEVNKTQQDEKSSSENERIQNKGKDNSETKFSGNVDSDKQIIHQESESTEDDKVNVLKLDNSSITSAPEIEGNSQSLCDSEVSQDTLPQENTLDMLNTEGKEIETMEIKDQTKVLERIADYKGDNETPVSSESDVMCGSDDGNVKENVPSVESVTVTSPENTGLVSKNDSEIDTAECTFPDKTDAKVLVSENDSKIDTAVCTSPDKSDAKVSVVENDSEIRREPENISSLESTAVISDVSSSDADKSVNLSESKFENLPEIVTSVEIVSQDNVIGSEMSTDKETNESNSPNKMNTETYMTTSGSSSSLEIVQIPELATQELSEPKEVVNDSSENVLSEIKCETQTSEENPPYKQTEKLNRDTSESTLADSDASRISDLSLSPNESSQGGTDSDTNKLDSSLDTYTSDDTLVDKAVTGDGTTEIEDHYDGENMEGVLPHHNLDIEDEDDRKSIGSVSPSSSYVKCMIEEAMEDGVKIEDNNSDTHSNGGEKSECSRSTGGHDSGDEFSTTTSSDIEIISTPNSNGDGNKIVDLSPLKIALQKTARRGTSSHRRSDSQSSSSTQSREGQGEQLSPGRDSLEGLDDGSHHEDCRVLHEDQRYRQNPELSPLSEESSGAYHPQNLLKKLAETTEILQARENKLVQLSKENLDLIESNSILHNQLQQLESARETELEDINNVNAEFSKRISESEKKINQVIREKETLKKQLKKAEDELAKKVKDRTLQNILEEKDVQIAELLQEGEKLSKQQLQLNTVIKKLRAKEKENDSLLTSQKKKLEEQKTELDHLKKVCDSKDDMEKKQTDAINQLNSAVQKQERDMTKMKSDLEDSQERVRGLQAALDKSYKEIADLHRSNAAQDSKAQETALSVEMQVREELKAQLGQEQKNFTQEKEALITQIEDLRLTLSRMEKEHNRKEDMLRQEISDLQRHLQEDEARNQELTHSVTSATRPLLRQIENLQSTYTAQAATWEKLEKNLSDRLGETQMQLATAVEKERYANEKVMELTAQITSLESQTSRLKQDKAQLTAQMEILKAKVEVLGDSKNSELAQAEALQHQMSLELTESKKEKVFLETQLEMEKTKLEQEKKKLSLAHDQISQLERDAQRPLSRGSQSPMSVSRAESFSGESVPMFASLTQDDLERSFILSSGGQKTSLYESLRQSGAASLLENLQSQLKQREGEILQLRSDIQQLERTRESMARELVNLTNQNEELQARVEELPELKKQLEDVDQRYNALLQMYGEKVEEADELRLDLQDVKEMYKTQIDHLLAK